MPSSRDVADFMVEELNQTDALYQGTIAHKISNRSDRELKPKFEMSLDKSIPDLATVLNFGARHNPDVWLKHVRLLPHCSELQTALKIARSEDFFTRRQVFQLAQHDAATGVIAAMVWGFPRGGPRGRHEGFVRAFNAVSKFVDILDSARAKPTDAVTSIRLLNDVVSGVGFATTSKILYFTELNFNEGKALIFDRNVIKAIIDRTSPWSSSFPKTRELLGTSYHWYGRAANAYGTYVREAHETAALLSGSMQNVCPSQVETALFLTKARPGTWRASA